jgi:hypothetical protein
MNVDVHPLDQKEAENGVSKRRHPAQYRRAGIVSTIFHVPFHPALNGE